MNPSNATTAVSWWDRRLFWNVKTWQAVAFLGFYSLFGLIYWAALYLNSSGEYNAWDQTIINYSLKALCSLPVYWLIFIHGRQWKLLNRLLIHLVTMPVYIMGWLFVFHQVCDFFDIGYLQGRAMVWDIYIPFLLYFLQFGFLHFYEYVNKSRLQQKKEHELRQAALQSEVNALKAQLQPHFLFNTLNSISASVPPDMEHTRKLIAQLADTFRFGLQASQSDRVPLRDEIHFIKTYLELEKQRYGTRLLTDLMLTEDLLDYKVPPMLLQPLVENAVKHGVGNSLSTVKISISVSRVGEGLCFEVADTGNGYPGDVSTLFASNGIGLRNTRLRLEKQFGETLLISKNKPQGMRFSYKIPIEK